MYEFIRNTFSRQKLQQLCVNTALSNFVGYVAGSLVMVLTTYHSVERRAFKNLFGILPRKEVVVHRLPEWLEWTLAVLLGFLVMELVRHIIRSNKFLRLIDGPMRDRVRGDGEKPTTG
jgi:iron-sulfur cluster repair protein YtfE (RIC family)